MKHPRFAVVRARRRMLKESDAPRAERHLQGRRLRSEVKQSGQLPYGTRESRSRSRIYGAIAKEMVGEVRPSFSF